MKIFKKIKKVKKFKKNQRKIFLPKNFRIFFSQKYCRKLFWTKNIHPWTKNVEILKQLIFFCKMQRMQSLRRFCCLIKFSFHPNKVFKVASKIKYVRGKEENCCLQGREERPTQWAYILVFYISLIHSKFTPSLQSEEKRF